MGIAAQGRKELKAHREGKRLTYRQMVIAKCYECVGDYIDGKHDCRIQRCPLYSAMPYGELETPKNESSPVLRKGSSMLERGRLKII